MVGLRILTASAAAFSLVLAMPIDHDEEFSKSPSIKDTTAVRGNPASEWSASFEIVQSIDDLADLKEATPEHSSPLSTLGGEPSKKAHKECKKQAKQRVCNKKAFPDKHDRTMCELDRADEYIQCLTRAEQTYGGLHRRQFPGISGAEGELLKDAGKAGIWFAEHCAPEMILAKFQGRKPHYDGLKEKFLCPAIAKTFPHLLPFENPFDAMEMPGPVMDEHNATPPVDVAIEA